jgi:ornithine cyclodeaminase
MPVEQLRFLDRAAVDDCLRKIDPADVIAATLRHHAQGRTELPPEGYLSWTNSEGAYSRAIAMLGAVPSGGGTAYGMKLINASVSNPRHGMERAGGLSFLFDPETARPVTVAEAGRLSAVRTAAYTVVSLRELGPPDWDAVGLIGTGMLAATHVDLLVDAFPALRRVHVYDLDPDRAAAFRRTVGARHPGLTVEVAPDARAVAAGAPVLITVTTSNDPYLPAEWLPAGGFVAHVSLGDLTEEVFLGAEALYVDDAELIQDNPRRIMGRLMREGSLVWPHDPGAPTGAGRVIDGSLGQVLLGQVPARRPSTGYVVSNPFGMAVLDVALMNAVAAVAEQVDAGQRLALF